MTDRPDILGSALLIAVFGYWPGFHDAEVRSLELKVGDDAGVGPDLTAEIYVFEMTEEVSSSGSYVLRKQSLVTIRFGGVANLQMEGFSHQNALMGLSIRDIRSQQMENIGFDVRFDGSLGFGARFVCREVVVEKVQPSPAASAPRPTVSCCHDFSRQVGGHHPKG